MSKQEKKGLVPERRFPEFRDAGEWGENTFGGAANFLNGRAYKQDELLDKGKYRVLRVGNFFSNNQWYYSDLELEEDKYCDKGDLLYAWSASFGPRIWQGEKVIYHYHIWKVLEKNGVDRNFLFILLGYETERMKSKSANGLGLMHITKGAIDSWKCLIPEIEEQQKIADCLTSVDELITAQTQKLDALKTHKKGLMQQLFPAKGESVPKRRFPEFQDKGEWVEKTLEQVAEYENGKAHEQEIEDQGKYVVVNSKFISTEGDIRKFSNAANLLAKKDDILMVLSDVPNGRAIAKCFYVDKDNVYTVNQRICKLTAKKNAVSLMLFYILDRGDYFLAFDDGVKQTNLKKDDVLNCPVLLPNDIAEQQKIVDCLTSIDELISNQAKKVEALKAHKKGLMQQLFPAMDAKAEVEA